MLLYNIWFEVAAIGFIAIIWVFYRVQYERRQEINKRFEILTCFMLMQNVFDISSAATISYFDIVPVWVNYVLNGLSYIFLGLAAFAFARYVRTLVNKDKSFHANIEHGIVAVYVTLQLLNPFFGFFFSFDETGYVHGPLYMIPLLTSYYYVVVTAVVLVKNYKNLSTRKVVGTGCYVVSILLVGVVQIFFTPQILLSGFASAMALLIIYLLMETPDYYKLISAMEELEKAKDQANQANEAKSKFLANMSHEIRTPLNTVLGMDEMILREGTEPEIIEYARNIKTSGTTLLGIINDILDFSKIESGNFEISPYNYNFSKGLGMVYIMFSSKAVDKGLEFVLNVDPNLPKTLYGDEKRIEQIIINLSNNAIKYTEKGSVKLSIESKPCDEESMIMLRITVKDTGIGIKEADMVKLFEEFERVDEERNRNIEGTGLGLAIASRLTHSMNGTIKVESVYNEGSTFIVEIPQKVINAEPIGEFKIKSEKTKEESYTNSFEAPDARILAVDDNRVNLVVLKNLLKATKVQLSMAQSGREALNLLENDKYDIVLLDHMMPEMDGIETFHMAKDIDERLGRKTVYVILTANAINGAEEYYIAEGFDAYLTKPIDSKLLEKTMKKFLAGENC